MKPVAMMMLGVRPRLDTHSSKFLLHIVYSGSTPAPSSVSVTTSTSRASIHCASPPCFRQTAAKRSALQISPWPTTKSVKVWVAMPAMEMALSMAFRLPMSSLSLDTNCGSSGPMVPSSSVAVLTCFSRTASRSSRNAGSCWAAFSTILINRSVVFTGEVGWLPIALTTTIRCSPSLTDFTISLAASLMRSGVATQVPPNLCTLHIAPRGHSVDEVTMASDAAAAQTARRRWRCAVWRGTLAAAADVLRESCCRPREVAAAGSGARWQPRAAAVGRRRPVEGGAGAVLTADDIG
mmetsp:Transcript_36968/g.95880  ORF Transcript_36968/g.95880 Transcript_36968/m.95880 type:complete len:294 (-) Transcript_36968:96-977(-)